MAALLVAAFVAVPVLELYVIVTVGKQIGAGWTIALLLAISLAGGWLVRREGSRAWRALQTAVGAGRLPERELADAALVLVGGVLLLTPGFCTDVAGLTLVLPATRPAARRLLSWVLARRARSARVRRTRDPGDGRRIVRGEVVDPPDTPDR